MMLNLSVGFVLGFVVRHEGFLRMGMGRVHGQVAFDPYWIHRWTRTEVSIRTCYGRFGPCCAYVPHRPESPDGDGIAFWMTSTTVCGHPSEARELATATGSLAVLLGFYLATRF